MAFTQDLGLVRFIIFVFLVCYVMFYEIRQLSDKSFKLAKRYLSLLKKGINEKGTN